MLNVNRILVGEQIFVLIRYKGDEEIKIDSSKKVTEEGKKYRLEVRNIRSSDAGLYKCKIINRLGEKSETAQLSVLSKFKRV